MTRPMEVFWGEQVSTVSCKINSKISTRGILTARGYDFELSKVFSSFGIATTRRIKLFRGLILTRSGVKN